MTLCLKTTLLKRMESSNEGNSKHDPNNREEIELDEVPKPVLAKGESSRKTSRLSEFELEAIYHSSETTKEKSGFTENPMLDASENMEEEEVNKSEYLKLMEVFQRMELENSELRNRNETVCSENDTLRVQLERLRGNA